MKNYKKIILFAFIFLVIVIIGSQVAQAMEYKPQIQIPGTDFASVVKFEETTGTYYIARYVMAIYQYGVSIGAILATVVLMAAGLMWLTSGGSQEKIGQAKNYITGSIIGLILLFGSYTILNTVNPELVNFHIQNIPSIQRLEFASICIMEENERDIKEIIDEITVIGDKYYKNEEEINVINEKFIVCPSSTKCFSMPNEPNGIRYVQCLNPNQLKCCEYNRKDCTDQQGNFCFTTSINNDCPMYPGWSQGNYCQVKREYLNTYCNSSRPQDSCCQATQNHQCDNRISY